LSSGLSARLGALGYDYASEPKERIALCNLCGGRVFATLTHHDRYGFAATTDACVRCGLTFLNPRLTEASYGRFYESVYRPLVSAYHDRLIDASSVEAEQEEYARRLAVLLEPFVTRRSGVTILDVGGSTGVVSAVVATRLGATVVVLDPAPAEVERARARGLKGHVATIESADFGTDRFDVILVCQTIDHLQDIKGSLQKLRSVIADTGLLYVDIVDFRAAYLGSSSVEQATKIDHPYSLTEGTAEAYLAATGFAVVHKDYAADHLHVGYLCSPGERSHDLPSSEDVRLFFRELRSVQSQSAPS
jgi:ubiquinone/menaquinone biosynthesis C-methylase UbiE